MERSRRQPVVSASKAGAKSAIEALKAAREGSTKRVADFEIKREDALYDVVTEQDYAQLAAKRRAEGGDFIVDDDGNYQDLGEDDYWNERAEEGDEVEAAEAGGQKQKKRKADAKGCPCQPTVHADVLTHVHLTDSSKPGSKKRAAAEGTGNITKMFKTAAARHAAAMPRSAESQDNNALLADILSSLGGNAAPVAIPTSVPRMPVNIAGARPPFSRQPAAPPKPTDMASAPRPAASRSPAAGLQLCPIATKKEEPCDMVEEGPCGMSLEEVGMEESPETDPGVADLAADPLTSPVSAAEEPVALVAPASAPRAAAARCLTPVTTPPRTPEEEGRPASGWSVLFRDGDCGPSAVLDSEAGAEEEEAGGAAWGFGARLGGGPDDSLPLDAEGNLPFFFLDAYDNSESRPGDVFLFGKVCAGEPRTSAKGGPRPASRPHLISCCVLVKGMHRSLIVVPRREVFQDPDGEIKRLEMEAALHPQRKIDLIKYLQGRCEEVKKELRKLLLRHGIKQHRMVPVKRNYAFEVTGVPHGEQYCIKVRYAASDPSLPLGLSGETFVAIFGAQQSPLEALVIKRGLRGPSWLSIKGAARVTNQMSWCKLEVTVPSSKCVSTPAAGSEMCRWPSPPLVVASLQLKTLINPSSHQHEAVAASVVHLSSVDADAPMSKESWNQRNVLRNFTVVRKLDGHAWPPGLEQEVRAANASPQGRLNGGRMLMTLDNERQMLSCLLENLQALDADVLVGHNIGAGDLTTLMYRMQHLKVELWSRIGRLRRTVYPKLTGGGHSYGGGASPGVMSALAGRVLCDTYVIARELVREVDYTLNTLSMSLLGEGRMDLPNVPRMYEDRASLLKLCHHTESDAWLALGIMFNLSALPLTKQLTNLSGSLWGRTLAGQRAQRIEMLLLHEFHARKFILPDKLSQKERERLASSSGGAEEGDGEDMEEGEEQREPAAAVAKGKGKAKAGKAKGPQYSGGLVLEPKKGLYDKIVIVLDFNSLYPSIIQEYNICFTTVHRSRDGGPPPLPDAPAPGVGMAPLPTVIQGLVHQRRQVKNLMSSERNPARKQQLNIQQQALKLTANSMYGCLGFGNSRFFARPLAELVTLQGRTILQSTVDLVQSGTINGEVIYGDTDSVMVYTATDDVKAARELGARIKKEVNKRYKLLEIELDAVFKCMLLLKKKKYAAVKLEPGGPAGQMIEVIEQKGLDIVRRDWCFLSKDVGNYVLTQILSGRPKEDVVLDIHNHLRSVREQVVTGQVPLGKFVINKQLTKRPEDYPDAKNQPHVMVAARMKAAGKKDGVGPGETVPYVICVRAGVSTPAIQTGLSETLGSMSPGEAALPGAGIPHSPPGPQGPGARIPQSPPGPQAASPEQQLLQQPSPRPSPQTSPLPTPQQPSPQPSPQLQPIPKLQPASHSAGSFAERAFHPDELRASGGSLVIDVEYYLGHQVHPVVSRLCAPIEGTDGSRIADCLGLDPSRFRGGGGGGGGAGANSAPAADDYASCLSALDDDANFVGLDPLVLKGINGSGPFPFLGVTEVLHERVAAESLLCPPDCVGDPTMQLSAAQLSNQAMLRAREAISRYYDGALVADDETAPFDSRNVVLRAAPDGRPDTCPHPDKAGVLLMRAIPERKLYLQLSSFLRQLNPDAAVKRVHAQMRAFASRSAPTEEALLSRLLPIRPQLQAATTTLQAVREASAYHWVKLGALFGVAAGA